MSIISKIIKTPPTGYSAKGRSFAKGDYVDTETYFNIFTSDGRKCATDRKGILSMLIELLGPAIKNITDQRLEKLIGTTLKESSVIEEQKRTRK